LNGGGDHFCVDLGTADGATPPQITAFWHDWENRSVVHSSLTVWLNRLVGSMEAGTYKVPDRAAEPRAVAAKGLTGEAAKLFQEKNLDRGSHHATLNLRLFPIVPTAVGSGTGAELNQRASHEVPGGDVYQNTPALMAVRKCSLSG
jgi:hypothetical protein